MACSHEGKLDLGKSIADASASAGADILQLQIWQAGFMMSPQRSEFALLQQIEIPKEEWASLVQYVRERHSGMKIYACVYEHQSIGFIDSLGVDGFKLNSSDLSNPLVLDKVAECHKPINLSVGASAISEIEQAIVRLKAVSEPSITLMYGFQNFPTDPVDVHLKFMETLKKEFNLPVGYQDHTDADVAGAFWLPAAAIGFGATVIEKHVTHDRALKGIDHESALNPDEFHDFVEMVKMVDSAAGSAEIRPFSPREEKYRQFQKKSIVAACALGQGAVLRKQDLLFMRAERLGLAPSSFELLLGRTLSRRVEAFQPLMEEDLIS
jgi:sialic acid synthase SpsE